MLDKKTAMEWAKNFVGEGSAYAHCEMMEGREPEILIAGDALGLMWLCSGIIKRVADLMGGTYEHCAELTFSMPGIGYGNLRKILGKKEYRMVQGSDWQEEWKKEKEKEIKKEANLENITLALNMAEMEKKNTSLNNQLVDLKKKHTKELKAKDDTIKALNKEILVLEHRLKEMEEQRLFNHDDE